MLVPFWECFGRIWDATDTKIVKNPSRSRGIFGSKNEWVSVVKRKDVSPGDLIPVEVDGLALLIAADLGGDSSMPSSFFTSSYAYIDSLPDDGYLLVLTQGRFMQLTRSVHLLELL